MQKLTATKDALFHALNTEFENGPVDVTEHIQSVVRCAYAFQGDFHTFDAYLNLEITATA